MSSASLDQTRPCPRCDRPMRVTGVSEPPGMTFYSCDGCSMKLAASTNTPASPATGSGDKPAAAQLQY